MADVGVALVVYSVKYISPRCDCDAVFLGEPWGFSNECVALFDVFESNFADISVWIFSAFTTVVAFFNGGWIDP